MSKEPKKDEIKRYRRKRRSPNVPTHYSQIKVGKPKGSGGPTEEMIRQAFVACSQFGCTNAELGKLLNMSTGMIQKWIMNVSPFREAVLAGRDQYDNRVVEKSLRERAQGYNKKIREIRRDNEGKTTNIEKEIYIPPDTKAAIFWLSRRHPERWSEKGVRKKININVDMKINEDIEHTAEVARILMESGAVGLDLCQLSESDRVKQARNVTEDTLIIQDDQE